MSKFDPSAAAVKVRQGTMKLKDVPEKKRPLVRAALSHSGRLSQYQRNAVAGRTFTGTAVHVRKVKAH